MTGSYTPTLLGHAILGLLNQEARSGHAVRKVFEQTAMGHFSSSPGAIYPALRRLSGEALVERVRVPGKPAARASVYRLTRRGRAALRRWLRRPITRDDVIREDTLLLRFAFMAETVSVAEQRRFLEELKVAVDDYAEELEAFRKEHAAGMALAARATFEHGIELYRCHSSWAARTLARLREVS